MHAPLTQNVQGFTSVHTSLGFVFPHRNVHIRRWSANRTQERTQLNVCRSYTRFATASQLEVACSNQQNAPSTSQSVDVQHDTVIPTHFCWAASAGGTSVELWGSFNNWKKGVPMHRPAPGADHRLILYLRPGMVEYKFMVDGAWATSEQELQVYNKEGSLNNFRVVQPTIGFSLAAPEAAKAFVVGNWDNWQYSVPLTKDPLTGKFTGRMHLKAGQYNYQYVVDGRLVHNPAEEVAAGSQQNKAWAVEAPAFRVFYCTGWDNTVLWYRRVMPGEHRPTLDFEGLHMVSTGSRGNELGNWKVGVVVPEVEGEMLEIFFTNGKSGTELKEDRPQHSSSRSGGSSSTGGAGAGAGSSSKPPYVLPRAGSFKLTWGTIKPFPRGAEPRFMLVSDIDGTMIGEHGCPDQYCTSKKFRDYWESGPALAGSLLVYNTGRSIGQVTEMLKSVPSVPQPDACIVAVGTKVFINKDESGRGRSTSHERWQEDMEWSRQLDAGWDLALMRSVGKRLLKAFTLDRVNVLDDGSEHPHRYSLNAEASLVQHVVSTVREAAEGAGLEIRVIVSGSGTHRYIDCVPHAAGKEKALQYLRKKYAIPEHYCVAAGDSGNDILMLEGDHPSIVVGNAQPELLAWLSQQPQDGKVVLTDGRYAEGILEGLARHGLY